MDKNRINKLVNIYIDDVLSVKHDAGWEGESMLARLIMYKGDIPPATGNDQSNITMINAMRMMRNTHAEFPKIAAAMQEIKIEYALAILARNLYQGINKKTEKTWTHEEKADEYYRAMKTLYALQKKEYNIPDNTNTYFYNLQKAVYAISAEIERLENYDLIREEYAEVTA